MPRTFLLEREVTNVFLFPLLLLDEGGIPAQATSYYLQFPALHATPFKAKCSQNKNLKLFFCPDIENNVFSSNASFFK